MKLLTLKKIAMFGLKHVFTNGLISCTHTQNRSCATAKTMSYMPAEYPAFIITVLFTIECDT